MTITIAQGISHVSWRIVSPPPPVTELQTLSVSKGAEASYERTVEWALDKKVANAALTPSEWLELVQFAGNPGQSFDVLWRVIATKMEDEDNGPVVGEITIGNPNNVDVHVDVSDVLHIATYDDDGVLVNLEALDIGVGVDCNPEALGNQAFGTVPANGSLTCSYTASPENRTANLNIATVTVTGYERPADSIGDITGGQAEAEIVWEETVIGDDEVRLEDERFSYTNVINRSTEVTFPLTPPETFTCSTGLTHLNDE
jgi:hypothetical protein